MENKYISDCIGMPNTDCIAILEDAIDLILTTLSNGSELDALDTLTGLQTLKLHLM